ncbi:methyl-accepting chemotaxis protein [Paenibacillus sp. L3-i20]|uniref:methyl-accepting chemotaxis protein n=1 Tax=Paenibacillus sp. L3-i20 TaxID=2905833 RepID=UPI001EDE57DF|nr:methyl-accepting chemotaxis protein [Paenibacillus sp. L3-i20]GKU77789.1 methyl-accepting chemotaxis protein [Paenibacillus sp. L3-i20]
MRKKLQWNLKLQLLVTMVVLVLLSTLSMGLGINQRVKDEMTKDFYEATRKEIEQVSGAIDLYFTTVNESVEYFAKSPLVKKIDGSITSYVDAVGTDGSLQMTPAENGGIEGDIYNFFLEYSKTHKNVPYIYLGTKDGQYIQWPDGTTVDKFDPRTRAWYTQAVENPDKIVRSGAYAAFTTGAPIVSSSMTIKDNAGNIVGVQGVDVSLDFLTNTINEMKIGKNGYVILADHYGTILANPKNPETNFKTLKDLGVPDFVDIDKAAGKNLNIEMNEEEYTASVYVSPETKWKYIAIMDESEVAESVNEIENIIFLIMAVIAIIAIVVALYLASVITKPLNAAVQYLQQIGNGDLAVVIPESMLKKQSEVGTMVRAINEMKMDMQKMIGGISTSGQIVSQSADKLIDSMDQTQQSSSLITESIIQLASASNDEANNVMEGSEKVEQLGGAIDQVAASAQDILDLARRTAELNQRGIVIVQELVGKFNSTQQASEETAQAINHVSGSAGEISGILRTILEISSQTNLLALNASIEAARAGEHGRGFSVVAAEIRKLAEQSAFAANNISHIISNVNNQVGAAVQAIGTSRELFVDQETAVRETEFIFNDIMVSVNSQMDMTNQVDGHIQLMVEKRDELTDVFTNISAITEENAAITQDVSAAAEEQLATIDNIAGYLTQLQGLSKDLESNIKKFNIHNQ